MRSRLSRGLRLAVLLALGAGSATAHTIAFAQEPAAGADPAAGPAPGAAQPVPGPVPATPPAPSTLGVGPGAGPGAVAPERVVRSADFTVGDIRVEGLQRIAEGTVYN
ncbi:MAG: hypothetical protein ACK53C_18240, partial [Pseudomonadota bacterium]